MLFAEVFSVLRALPCYHFLVVLSRVELFSANFALLFAGPFNFLSSVIS